MGRKVPNPCPGGPKPPATPPPPPPTRGRELVANFALPEGMIERLRDEGIRLASERYRRSILAAHAVVAALSDGLVDDDFDWATYHELQVALAELPEPTV